MVQLFVQLIRFFRRPAPRIAGVGVETKRPVEWVTMSDEQDWLLRPVLEGMCSYESLINGSIDLVDVDIMNEAIDVHIENKRRMHRANED